MAHKYVTSTTVYYRCGLSATDVGSPSIDYIIDEAEREVELVTGRNWESGAAVTVTEFQNGPKMDVFDNKKTDLILENYPVRAIGSLLFLNNDGTAYNTFSGLTAGSINAGVCYTNSYWLDPNMGKVTFISDEVPVGTRNVKILYSYGQTDIPTEIKALVECLSGIRAWVTFLGGNYGWLDNYSIPEQSVSKPLYSRGMEMIKFLTEEAERLYQRIGKRSSTLAFFTGGSR